jgi:hypothetical protein
VIQTLVVEKTKTLNVSSVTFNRSLAFFHGCTVYIGTIGSCIYPTDAQLDCSKIR